MSLYDQEGILLDSSTGAALANYTVEVWDIELAATSPLATATTTDNGSFSMSVDDDEIESILEFVPAGMYFKVYDAAGTLIGDTKDTIIWPLTHSVTSTTVYITQVLTGQVDGLVADATEGPIANADVRLYSRRSEIAGVTDTLLANAASNDRGRFRIRYAISDGRPINLVVKAFDAVGVPLTESNEVCRAPAQVEVSLIVNGTSWDGPSEAEQLDAAIARELAAAETSLASMTEAAARTLACGASADQEQLVTLAAAAALAQSTGVPRDVFYGMARSGLGVDMHRLVAASATMRQDAFEAAVSRRAVRIPSGSTSQQLMDQLAAAIESYALTESSEPGRPALKDVLSTSLVSTSLHQPFIAALVRRSGSDTQFWEDVANDPTFSGAAVDELKLTFQLAGVLQGFVEVQQQLAISRGAGQYLTLREVAKIARTEWISKVQATGSPIAFPPHVPGSNEQERLDHYVDAIMAVLDAAFPSDALRRDLSGSSALSAAGDIFLASNSELDLVFGNIDNYLIEQGAAAFTGIADPEEQTRAVAEAKMVQRLARVAPKSSWVKILAEQGYYSASQISSADEGALIEQLSGLLGGDDNVKVVKAAANGQSAAAQTMAMLVKDAQDLSPMVMQSSASLDSTPATIATLFGGAGYCACDHCSSVYSPAAYLVDLLKMLDVGSIGDNDNPVNVLLRRRPDIANITLSCANINTAIPYIDLVNEILEAHVAPGGDPSAAVDTGDYSAEQLRAAPQRVLQAAYTALQDNAVYPLSLPFSRPLEVGRQYLARLGTSHREIMERFSAPATPDAAQPADINRERLGLSKQLAAVIMGTPLSGQPIEPYAYLGFDSADSATWATKLAAVPELLTRMAITFDELKELIATRFIADGDTVEITTTSSDCDIDNMTLSPASEQRFARMHRLVRLKRAMGWSYAALDTALAAFGAADITATVLDQLAAVEQLRDTCGSPVVVTCTLFSNIDVFGETSLYDKLFLNRGALSSSASSDFELNAARTELIQVDALTLAQRAGAVAAAIGVGGADLTLLLAALNAADPINGHKLSLANLSFLYRYAVFARMLRIGVDELLVLAKLSGLFSATLAPLAADAAISLLQLVDQLRRSGFTVAELSYVYLHTPLAGRGLMPADDYIDGVLTELQTNLISLGEQLQAPVSDQDGFLAYVSRFVEDDSVPAELAAALDYASALTQQQRIDRFATHLPTVDIQSPLVLFPATPPSDPNAHLTAARSVVLEQLHSKLKVELPANTVTYAMAAALNLSSVWTRQLLDMNLAAVAISGESILAELTRLIQPSELPSAYRASFLRAHKGAILVRRMAFPVEDAPAVLAAFDNAASAPVNISQLPVSAPVDPAVEFAQWPLLVSFSEVAATLRTAAAGLSDIMSATPATAPELLGAAAGWDVDQVATLMGPSGFNFSTAELTDPVALLRVVSAMRLLGRTGVSAAAALSWATATVAASQADDMVSAVRAQYTDETAWFEVARAANDPLREKQRDALVAYLLPQLAESGVASHEELYGHLLIDTEMSACMRTSRVKQAISSVQQFVQRVLLNLERSAVADDDVPPSKVEAEQWEWRKNYRIWEANRKVFLYPENWIEPELRTDKSPFFRELESELRQGDLTDEAIEAALSNYLHKLDEVSRLVPVAHLWENNARYQMPKRELLHIVARTAATPYRYYYRNMSVAGAWTAWERIDLDIGTEQMVLMIVDGRLQLCWPTYVEQTRQATDGVSQQFGWSIRIQQSERRNSAWSAPRASNTDLVVFSPVDKPKRRPEDHFLRVDPGNMIVVEQRTAENAYRGVGRFVVRLGDIVAEAFDISFDNFGILTTYHDSVQGAYLLSQSYQRTPNVGGDLRLLSVAVLAGAPSARVLFDNEDVAAYADTVSSTFFVSDGESRYLVEPEVSTVPSGSQLPVAFDLLQVLGESIWDTLYTFRAFHHLHAYGFVAALNRYGSAGLLSLATQQSTLDFAGPGSHFNDAFSPVVDVVAQPYPVEDVTFRHHDAMALYNWELFFHVPLLVATRLNQEQRHEEARRWFHFVFDPTSSDAAASPARFWKCLPFRNNDVVTNVNAMMLALADPAAYPETYAALQSELAVWMKYPFEPHRIAQLRLGAYQKMVVMKYIDNLLDWGDKLFRRDTMESLNEATQLYVLAASILGQRQVLVAPPNQPAPTTFAMLRPKLKATNPQDAALSNALIQIENYVTSPATDQLDASADVNGSVGVLAFCAPQNEQLLGYWERVSDRLFKLRHCLTIQGQQRELPLFEPPIDPALLVRARAAGVDFSAVLDDLYAAPTPYRFSVVLAKAQQLAGETRAFGGALLAALEKRDGEELAALRANQEASVLETMRTIKRNAVKEAQLAQQSLIKARQHAEDRLRFYRSRTEAGLNLNAEEETYIKALDDAERAQASARGDNSTAALVALIPDFSIGITPPFSVSSSFGGSSLAALYRAFAEGHLNRAAEHSYQANRSSIAGGWKRRHDDWVLQAEQAEREMERIDKDLLAAEVREQIAQSDLEVHEKQIENAKAVQSFLSTKRTNMELYDWMFSKLRDVYFQAYKLAYDMAKRAERAYRQELGIESSNIIQFGYWDSLKQGLLAGEQLALALQQLDVAYTTEDRREHELTKTISLARLDPKALMAVRHSANGAATFSLPEWLFDVDYPGHYLRRIRAVRITIPAVAGPHTNINCRLTQMSSRIRRSNSLAVGYGYAGVNDTRFAHRFGPTESICTSNAQGDGGLFELTFQDPRYLPFEGTGVVSDWKIEMDPQSNAFDMSTITDILLHISYSSRDGGDPLRSGAKVALGSPPAEAFRVERVFSLKHEFSTAWNAFETALDPVGDQVLTFSLAGKLPYLLGTGARGADDIRLAVRWAASATGAPLSLVASLKPAQFNAAASVDVPAAPDLVQVGAGDPLVALAVADAEAGDWQLRISAATLNATTAESVTEPYGGGTTRRIMPDAIEDIYLVVRAARGLTTAGDV